MYKVSSLRSNVYGESSMVAYTKKLLLTLTITLAALFTLQSAALAQESEFGLGVTLGDPTGVDFKWNLNEHNALDFVVGYGAFGGAHFYTHVEWHHDWHLTELGERARMDLYTGVGAKLGVYYNGYYYWGRADDDFRNSSAWFGIRAPIGLDFVFNNAPVDVFVELAPGMWLVQRPFFDFDAAVGARYWF